MVTNLSSFRHVFASDIFLPSKPVAQVHFYCCAPYWNLVMRENLRIVFLTHEEIFSCWGLHLMIWQSVVCFEWTFSVSSNEFYVINYLHSSHPHANSIFLESSLASLHFMLKWLFLRKHWQRATRCLLLSRKKWKRYYPCTQMWSGEELFLLDRVDSFAWTALLLWNLDSQTILACFPSPHFYKWSALHWFKYVCGLTNHSFLDRCPKLSRN